MSQWRVLAMQLAGVVLALVPKSVRVKQALLFASVGALWLSLPPVAHAGISVESATNPSNDHVYHIIRADDDVSGLTWMEAEQTAISLGGHLATIRSAAENAWVTSTFRDPYLWIGLNDATSEGHFVWSSGEPVVYTNWYPGEPNNLNDEDYVHIYNFDSGYRQWNDNRANVTSVYSWPIYGVAEVVPPPPPVTHVLCVGVRDNANNIFGDVAAQRVRDAFAKFPSVKTAWCLPLYQNNTLIDNREAFATMLNRMKDRVQPGDSFVLYFASHGTFEWLGDELPVEAQFSTKFPNLRIPPTSGDEWLYLSSVDKSQNISDDDLRSMFLGLSWEQMNKLFIIDCCYSGGFMGNTTNGDTGDLTTLSKAAVLAAAPEWDFAYAGWDDDADGYVNNLGKAVTCALDALQGLDSVTWFDLLSRTRLEGRRFEGSNSRILDFEDNWGTDLSAVFSPVDWSSSDFEFIFGIPEPATLSLLALGGLALLHRRRGASS